MMPRMRMEEDGPNPIDTQVGIKVKTRRLMLGFSQEDLAKAIGLTFQQVQKYEKGTNRISVSRLVDISRALKVSYDYFLEGIVANGSKRAALRGVSDNKQEALENNDPMTRKDVIELVRAYCSIRTPKLKKQLLEMAKAMAASSTTK
jgi:transcriptional regulator with XRE-family HTH domain